MLECMFKNVDNREEIITLIKCLLNEKIKDFKYIGPLKFNSIMEYEFSLIKIRIILENDKQKELYIKMIKGGKVKESIFCYWSLLHELNIDKAFPKKVTISEKRIEENNKDVILNFNHEFDYSTEIKLIKLKDFIIEKSVTDPILKKLLNYLENNDKDILFLGIIGID